MSLSLSLHLSARPVGFPPPSFADDDGYTCTNETIAGLIASLEDTSGRPAAASVIDALLSDAITPSERPADGTQKLWAWNHRRPRRRCLILPVDKETTPRITWPIGYFFLFS